MKEYRDMSDKEIKKECRDICRRSATEAEAVEAIKTKFGYKPAVHFGQPNAAGQKMIEGMIFGPRGNIIGF